MTYLFHLLQPQEKLRITKNAIAKMLNIPLNLIIRVECWTYVIFIHRQDRGGQFISYRQLREWQNAVASQIQKCQNLSQLNSLWIAIELDWYRYQAQYADNYLEFVQGVWSDRKSQLNQQSRISLAANY
ncbi:MAG: hypothetical protein QNJ60_10995 [Xenococcaceae cyanobacterium MO_188.B19]|nr:hypothetical protein [Xenococcaceae cyanobacterium MO_188.B19]